MTDRSKLKLVTHKASLSGGHDPSAMGKKGVQVREAKVMDHLTETRQYVNTLARPAAEYLGNTIARPDESHPLGVMAAKDILDRTVGKAPTELRVGPSEQTLDILRELDADG